MFRLFIEMLMGVLLSFRATVPDVASEPEFSLKGVVNQQRAGQGYSVLTEDPRMTAIAETRSREIVADFQHGDRLARLMWDYGFRTERGGEILCRARAIESCLPMWLASPSHAEQLYGPYRYFGVASYSNDGITWAVVTFLE